MQRYVCQVCGYVYDPAIGDPDNGVNPDTAFENLPDEWVCPVCGADKDSFRTRIRGRPVVRLRRLRFQLFSRRFAMTAGNCGLSSE